MFLPFKLRHTLYPRTTDPMGHHSNLILPLGDLLLKEGCRSHLGHVPP